ncbi:MAG: SprB repeat-containing protein [Cyclobacteriaceae bacterium]|nr:SprB repeat-containing protein [Cyclobacteriaceae bacterium]
MRLLFRLLSAVAMSCVTVYMSCSSGDEPEPFDCNTSDLAIQLVADNDPSECGTNNGSIQVSASGGQGPYQFKIGTSAYGNNATFSNLGGGSYNISVKDNRGCEKQLAAVVLTAPSGPVAGTPDISAQTDCLSPNGSVTANVTGGTPPYSYRIGSGSFGASATFSGLKAGNYVITVEDDADCTITINTTVTINTGVSYENDIKPILQANCVKSGCHDGNSGLPNWGVLSTVQANAQNIKLRTGNKTMPADIAPTGLPQNQIDLIACWVDEGAKNN